MGFNFQDDAVHPVDTDVVRLLAAFREHLEVFAKDRDFAQHIVDAPFPSEEYRAIDWNRWSSISSKFWQTRDWFFELSKVVPVLILEVMKRQPKNQVALEKDMKFWAKPFRFNFKGDQVATAAAYLSTIKKLEGQLKDCQEAARSNPNVEAVKIGKFLLHDSIGIDEVRMQKAIAAIKSATRAMASIGLGEYCAGNITIVNSSKLISRSAAFYQANTDDIFISPDIQGADDVRALCHEIGHRVHFKLHLKHQLTTLYEAVRDAGAWVTPYAKTDERENFSEMVAFAAIGKLDDQWKSALQATTNKIKLAYASNVVHRFLATR